MAEIISKSNASGYVTVACKLPNGLILHIDKMETIFEPVMGGGTRESKIASRLGEAVKINGNAVKFGDIPAFTIAGGYALTTNVPAEFWDAWLAQNKDSDMVKNGLVFAHGKSDYAADKAKEQKDVLSGLHAIIPDKDARIAGKVKVETAHKAA